MAGLNDYDCEGTLVIGGISMNRPAWAVMGDEFGENGLLPLWTTAEQRGSDRIIPGLSGAVPYVRRVTVTRHDLRLVVVGDVDENGAATSDDYEGLLSNLDYIKSNVVDPTGATDGTRAASVTFPGQSARTADIHVLGLQPLQYHTASPGSIFIGTLQISIPAGEFT